MRRTGGVDGGGKYSLVSNGGSYIVRRANANHNLPHSRLDVGIDRRSQRSCITAQHSVPRQYIALTVGDELCHRHHAVEPWIQLARDDGLQTADNISAHHNRIDAHMWQCGMTTACRYINFKQTFTGGDRAGAGTELTDWHAGDIVHTVNRIDRELLKQTVVNHC